MAPTRTGETTRRNLQIRSNDINLDSQSNGVNRDSPQREVNSRAPQHPKSLDRDNRVDPNLDDTVFEQNLHQSWVFVPYPPQYQNPTFPAYAPSHMNQQNFPNPQPPQDQNIHHNRRQDQCTSLIQHHCPSPSCEPECGYPHLPIPRPFARRGQKFTDQDDEVIRTLRESDKKITYEQMTQWFPGRSAECLQVRYCEKAKIRDIAFDADKDQKLCEAVNQVSEEDRWGMVVKKMAKMGIKGLTPKDCKKRWMLLQKLGRETNKTRAGGELAPENTDSNPEEQGKLVSNSTRQDFAPKQEDTDMTDAVTQEKKTQTKYDCDNQNEYVGEEHERDDDDDDDKLYPKKLDLRIRV